VRKEEVAGATSTVTTRLAMNRLGRADVPVCEGEQQQQKGADRQHRREGGM
jgi:hypothetical protein